MGIEEEGSTGQGDSRGSRTRSVNSVALAERDRAVWDRGIYPLLPGSEEGAAGSENASASGTARIEYPTEILAACSPSVYYCSNIDK